MKPSQIKQHILALSLAQKRSLLRWLTQVIAEEEKKALLPPAAPKSKSEREVIAKRSFGQVVYQLEQVRCGKEFCKCTTGDLHGPYWYGYQRSNGKLKSWYIGKTLKLEDDVTSDRSQP